MAQAISRFRQTLGDTQQQFAHRVGLSVTSVARYETNSPPSPKVLARFVRIAREADLPAFVEIFEDRLPPDEEINFQDFSAVKHLLAQMVEKLRPTQLRQGRLALAGILIPDENLDEAEREMQESLARVEDAVDEAAAELVRGRDPQVDRKRVHFLKTLDLKDYFAFTKAYEAFRAARLAEHKTKGLTGQPVLDMFAIKVSHPDSAAFEYTETAVVLPTDGHPISDEVYEAMAEHFGETDFDADNLEPNLPDAAPEVPTKRKRKSK
jgi:transcriptional regulator with XRE-family HTH domain